MHCAKCCPLPWRCASQPLLLPLPGLKKMEITQKKNHGREKWSTEFEHSSWPLLSFTLPLLLPPFFLFQSREMTEEATDAPYQSGVGGSHLSQPHGWSSRDARWNIILLNNCSFWWTHQAGESKVPYQMLANDLNAKWSGSFWESTFIRKQVWKAQFIVHTVFKRGSGTGYEISLMLLLLESLLEKSGAVQRTPEEATILPEKAETLSRIQK